MRVNGAGNFIPLQGMLVIQGQVAPTLPGQDPGAIIGPDGKAIEADAPDAMGKPAEAPEILEDPKLLDDAEDLPEP